MDKVVVYKVALYCRLSLDDGNVGESGSIQTQKIILEKYCKDNNLSIVDIYCDDGYSGLNFERPSFKKLLNDIESGKINMVITKDLSRKVKLAKRGRALNGLFISAQTPFGYMKDPNNKNHLVIDEEAKEIVIKIYKLAKQGLGTYRIAKLLNEEGVITPSRYKFQKGDTRFARFNNSVWRTETVNAILTDLQELVAEMLEMYLPELVKVH